VNRQKQFSLHFLSLSVILHACILSVFSRVLHFPAFCRVSRPPVSSPAKLQYQSTHFSVTKFRNSRNESTRWLRGGRCFGGNKINNFSRTLKHHHHLFQTFFTAVGLFSMSHSFYGINSVSFHSQFSNDCIIFHITGIIEYRPALWNSSALSFKDLLR